MNSIVKVEGAACRGPDLPESTEPIILRLSDDWALGYDRLQWMVMRWRGKSKGWRPVSFVASNKVVLRRVIAEKGITPTPEARSALAAFPDSFREWLAGQERREAA